MPRPSALRGRVYIGLGIFAKNQRETKLDRFQAAKIPEYNTPLCFVNDDRNSGVMTFMMNPDGVLIQEDRGQTTAEIASPMPEFDPDAIWSVVQ